jgi:tetrapyrrole methylase family protein/MazG family protein
MSEAAEKFEELLEIMRTLRAPGGCPWDREQTLQSLRRYLIEETYEVLDALERGNWNDLAEELGDLQLQIVFQARIAADEGLFDISDVLNHINTKLIRRHPHVFEKESIDTAAGVVTRWEEIKAQEKGTEANAALLDAVPRHQPAVLEAYEVGKKAAKVGFEWEKFEDLGEKLAEEFNEVAAARDAGDRQQLEDEVGDLLFMAVNVARYLNVHPETALKRTNAKFRARFDYVEQQLGKQGRTFEESSLDEMEALWQRAKKI